MKDTRPITVTRGDLKVIAAILGFLLFAGTIEPIIDAIANYLTN